jgi:hypothetical protein
MSVRKKIILTIVYWRRNKIVFKYKKRINNRKINNNYHKQIIIKMKNYKILQNIKKIVLIIARMKTKIWKWK